MHLILTSYINRALVVQGLKCGLYIGTALSGMLVYTTVAVVHVGYVLYRALVYSVVRKSYPAYLPYFFIQLTMDAMT